MAPNSQRLSEEYVQNCFHSYLKSSLTQAKAERLLDTELLSSAEGDLMITGPALCLYFAALRCTTYPPSVPLPRQEKANSQTDLSEENCPPSFISFLRVWANAVSSIQNLVPEHQHDLARIICGLDPVSQPLNPALSGIAADMRAVAIEISQRRTFQDRYASDLQAAIDSGGGGGRVASFVPPPVYQPSPSPSPQPSPRMFVDKQLHPPARPTLSQQAYLSQHSVSSGGQRSPLILPSSSPAIEFIRETLYAALADAIEQSPSIRRLLRTDPSRAYFASVSFAILDVATGSITPEGSVRGVLGQELTVAECPGELKPFMLELAAIGQIAKASEIQDDQEAIELVSRGQNPREPRMERVRKVLEQGIGYDARPRIESATSGMLEEGGRKSVEGRAVSLANRINGLALNLTKLKAFRDRQKDVFAVLAGISS